VAAVAINPTEVEALGFELKPELDLDVDVRVDKVAGNTRMDEALRRCDGPAPDGSASCHLFRGKILSESGRCNPYHRTDVQTVMAKMREILINDAFAENGRLRKDC
jgi:hypothetical protein